ncbi:MAG: PD-(D/E)XK nuclease family protein, partial [Stellaceae bacterium]
LLWTEDDGLPLWRPRNDFPIPLYDREREAVHRREMQEYRRLLYVALTRAQDRLYLCGWETRKPASAGCWYALCRAGLREAATSFDFDAGALIGGDGWTGTGLRLSGAQSAEPVPDRQTGSVRAGGTRPAWTLVPPPPEPATPRPLTPSRQSAGAGADRAAGAGTPAEEPAVSSPLALGGSDRFKRGLLIHRLLQSLPDLPPEERDRAARRFLALPTHALAAAEQDDIRTRTLALIAHPDFAPLFGPGSLAEVPVAGIIGEHALSGQIDRLVVAGERVLIVDYKTLRRPPARADDVPALYLRQLALYAAALARVYRGYQIRCALLFTETPLLMPIGADRLAPYLPPARTT